MALSLAATSSQAMLARPRACVPKARSRRATSVVAYTDWVLRPDPTWSKLHPDQMTDPVHLTPLLLKSKTCFVSARSPSEVKGHTEEVGNAFVLTHDNQKISGPELLVLPVDEKVRLRFEGQPGRRDPTDSPAELYVEDMGSECEVVIGNYRLGAGETVQLAPGSKIKIGGDKLVLQVQRNVHAHA